MTAPCGEGPDSGMSPLKVTPSSQIVPSAFDP
jgi:hypothetical protein